MNTNQEVSETEKEEIGPVTYKFAVKNIQKFLEKKGKEIDTAINSKLDNFIAGANQALKESDKKFTGMYNILIKKFLVEFENRLYTQELSQKTMLIIFAEKFHKIEYDLNQLQNQLTPINTDPCEKLGTTLSLTEYLQTMELNYATKMKEIHETSEAAAAAEQQAQQQVEVQNESTQEPVQEESTVPTESASEAAIN